jgi:hypothetical protein
VRAYEKAGFERVEISPEEIESEYGPRDYHDSVLLTIHAPED